MNRTCFQCFKETLDEHGTCSVCGYDEAKNREKYPTALPGGSILNGRYTIGKVLGQGGFGVTYLAQDYLTGQLVAIKEFFPDTMVTRVGNSMVHAYTGEKGENFQYGKTTFLEEAKTMAEFNGNPNIVGVQMYFEENGTAYFVMDYIKGVDLETYIRQRGGRLEWQEAIDLLLPVLDALEVIHAKGIIHRDVTPDNIYITADGAVKLLDFGAARHSLGNVSRSLDVILKHGFAPKEQYSRRGRQGPYTDVYSVSATLYFAITGHKPDDAIERMDEDELPYPSSLGAKITPEQEDTLLKGMAVKAEDRYRSAAELRNALLSASPVEPEIIPAVEPEIIPAPVLVVDEPEPEPKVEVSDPEPPVTVPETPGETGQNVQDSEEKKKKKMPLILSVAAVVLVVAFAAFWFLHPHSYGDWVEVKTPTCLEEGLLERVCFCDHKEVETIPALGHKSIVDPAVDPTCTEDGKTLGYHCGTCNIVLEPQKIILAKGHTRENIPEVEPTCTKEGSMKGAKCSVCGVELEAPAIRSPLGHEYSGNDCKRCDAKKWWVDFQTTDVSCVVGEMIEIYFILHTSEKGATTKLYYDVKYEYSSGKTALTDKKVFWSGTAHSEGAHRGVSWNDGISSPATVTLSIYDEDGHTLGSYWFKVK